MTRRELALLQTARSTDVCLDRHQASWTDLPGFARERQRMASKLAELEVLAGAAAQDRGNLAGQRQNVIQALAEEAWVVAGQVQACAAAQGQAGLQDSVAVTRDELVWLQMSLPERALEIHQRAGECLRQGRGAEFGLEQSRLDRLAELIQALKILRVPRACPPVAGDGPDPLFAAGLSQVLDVLCEVIDPLMRRFRSEQPDFFEAYQAARRVVDPETGTLLTSAEELASLEDDPAGMWDEIEGNRGRGPEWRPGGPAGSSRGKQGAAVLNS